MVSIIVANYNGERFIKNCLESLYATTYQDKEIIVVDNNSKDESVFYLMEEHNKKKIRLLRLANNVGLAKASNTGYYWSKGNYLFFLNNDTKVKEDIFERLLETINGKVAVLGCKMYNYDGTKELDSALSVDRFGYPAGKTGQIFYPDGAIFIRADVFKEIGGFDEELFLYGEDRDLCWRVLLAGWAIHYCPTAHFFHFSSCNNDTNFCRRKITEKNILRSMLKNYTFKSLLFILPQYLYWSILEIGLMLFVNPMAIWKSYLPAYWWNIVNLSNTLNQRKFVLHRISDKEISRIMSKEIGKWFVFKATGIPKFKEIVK